jgi:hypothetical protein
MTDSPLARVRAFQRAANPNRDYRWPAEEAANIGGVPLYFDDIEALVDADDEDAVDEVIRRMREAETERDRLTARVAELEAHPWIVAVWLSADDEGNFGAWSNPDHARKQLAHDWAAETPGAYEWVNDADRTCELLLRDGEPTGLTLRMALVADTNEGA